MRMSDRHSLPAAPPALSLPAPAQSARLRLGAGLLVAITVVVFSWAGCSVIVEGETNQCASDADCAEFGTHPFCIDGICVESGLGPPGCFYGAAQTTDEFQNQCTDSPCIPFDNCARLGLCGNAELPPLIDPPPP